MTTQRMIGLAALVAVMTTPMAAQMPMGGSMKGMDHSAMQGHGAMMPDMATMLQRTDVVMKRTSAMMGGESPAAGTHPMPMDHASSNPMQLMAGQMNHMAMGLQGMLQQMDGAQKSGMTMDKSAQKDWSQMHARMSTLLADMEKSMQTLERLQAKPAPSK